MTAADVGVPDLERERLAAGGVAGTLLVSGPAPTVLGMALQTMAVAGAGIVAFYYSDLYDLRIVRSFAHFVRRLPLAVAGALGLLAVLYVLAPIVRIPAGARGPGFLSTLALILAIRAAAYRMMRSRPFGERVLVLGACPLAEKLVTEIEAQPHLGYCVVGVVDTGGTLTSALLRYRHLGSLSDLDRIVRLVQPDRIVVTPSARRSRLPVEPLL